MARTVTRAALRGEIRLLSDTESDPHIDDDEINDRINTYIQRLWNRLVIADPDRCTQVDSIATTAGTASYTLEADFLEVRAVDLVSGDDRIQLRRWMQQNRWKHRAYSGYSPTLGYGETEVRYRIMGQGIDGSEARIHFLPDPGTNTYEVRYVEVAPTLTAESGAGGTLDGVAGFEQWIAYRVARDLMRKQQRYEGEFERDIAELDMEIDALAGLRDAGEAAQVADTRGPRFLTPSAR